jgi:ATP-dependent Zn protease
MMLTKKIAYHEAGHTVLYWELGYKVRLVTIVPDADSNTRGRTVPCDPERPVEDALTIAFAGWEAQVRSGAPVIAEDIQRDIEKVLHLQSREGLDDERRETCRTRARELVEKHWA